MSKQESRPSAFWRVEDPPSSGGAGRIRLVRTGLRMGKWARFSPKILAFLLSADVSICGAATSIGSGPVARIPRLPWYTLRSPT